MRAELSARRFNVESLVRGFSSYAYFFTLSYYLISSTKCQRRFSTEFASRSLKIFIRFRTSVPQNTDVHSLFFRYYYAFNLRMQLTYKGEKKRQCAAIEVHKYTNAAWCTKGRFINFNCIESILITVRPRWESRRTVNGSFFGWGLYHKRKRRSQGAFVAFCNKFKKKSMQ